MMRAAADCNKRIDGHALNDHRIGTELEIRRYIRSGTEVAHKTVSLRLRFRHLRRRWVLTFWWPTATNMLYSAGGKCVSTSWNATTGRPWKVGSLRYASSTVKAATE